MKKQFCCLLNKSVFIPVLFVLASVIIPHEAGAAATGTSIANDIGIKSVPGADMSSTAADYDAAQNAGCDADVWAKMMQEYNNAIQEINKTIETHDWAGKENESGLPKSVKEVSCFEDDLKSLWEGAEDIMSSVGKGFSFDLSGVKDGLVNSIKNEVNKINLGEMVCSAGNALKTFLKNQEQCFDFSKMFRWRKGTGKNFDECLIRAKINLNENGFKYSITSDYAKINTQGRFGLDDLGVLGDQGVNKLFDAGSWGTSATGGGSSYSSSLECGPLDQKYADAVSSGAIADFLYNPPQELKYEEDKDTQTWAFTWTPSAGATCEDGTSGNCETRSSCYSIKLAETPPWGTCFQTGADGKPVRNSAGLPKLLADATGTLCAGVSVPAGFNIDNTLCSYSYDGTKGDYADYQNIMSKCSVASADSNVLCLSKTAHKQICGSGMSMNCCDPSVNDCSTSVLPICYCSYAMPSATDPEITYTMWQTTEADGKPDDGNPVNNVFVPGTCPSTMVESCCNPELNDCENVTVLKGMKPCLDESKICVDFGSASIVDKNGAKTDVPLSSVIDTKDLFSVYEYLVIKPDAVLPTYAAETNKSTSGKGLNNEVAPPVQCCSTEWCNICPDMIRGAARLRDKGLTPQNIGVINNTFMNTGSNSRAADSAAISGEIGIDAEGYQRPYFKGSPTGNVFAYRKAPGLGIGINFIQPPPQHCLDVTPVPTDTLECALKWADPEGVRAFFKKVKEAFENCGPWKIMKGDCQLPVDPCKDVEKLPPGIEPYDSNLLSEGMPIANIQHSGDWEGEDPKLCTEYSQCENSEFKLDMKNENWSTGCTSSSLTEDEKNVCCAHRCDTRGVNSAECNECAPAVFGCASGWSVSERASRAACVTGKISAVIRSSSLITPEICAQNFCGNDKTPLMCAACGTRYSCSACGNNSLSSSCLYCLNNSGGTSGEISYDDGTLCGRMPPLGESRFGGYATCVMSSEAGCLSGGGRWENGSCVDPEFVRGIYQNQTQSLKTAPSNPVSSGGSTWQQQQGISVQQQQSPPQAPAGKSGGGISETLKSLF